MNTVCVKIGGSTIDTAGLLDEFARSVKEISGGSRVVVVHGGGKDIARQLNLLGKEFTFVEGMRVTDSETMKHVQMVLSGDVNKRIVNALLCAGVPSAGVSGVDLSLIEARRMTVGGRDIGQVGDVARVNTRLLDVLTAEGIVPVVSPVSRGADGRFYNVNADPAASEVAVALAAADLVFISDVPGVMIDSKVTSEIRCADVERLVAGGQVTGGMIPKLRSAAEAVARGVGRVHICGWRGTDTIGRELSVATSQGTVVY